MFGPVVVLDGNGFRDETDRFQRLLQRVPLSCGTEGRNADRDSEIERRRAETLSLAENIAAAYTKHQLLHEDEFAMNSLVRRGRPKN
jgi:hypothetical protein